MKATYDTANSALLSPAAHSWSSSRPSTVAKRSPIRSYKKRTESSLALRAQHTAGAEHSTTKWSCARSEVMKIFVRGEQKAGTGSARYPRSSYEASTGIGLANSQTSRSEFGAVQCAEAKATEQSKAIETPPLVHRLTGSIKSEVLCLLENTCLKTLS